jgi:hypothetical protein
MLKGGRLGFLLRQSLNLREGYGVVSIEIMESLVRATYLNALTEADTFSFC